MNPLRCAACLALGVLLASAAANAETVWIKRPTIEIRSGKAAVYPVVAVVHKGDSVEVIERDGKWLKVSVSGHEGYVFEEAVSNSHVDADHGNLAKALGGPNASNMSTGAASKGFGESQGYANARHLNPAYLKQMIAYRKAITAKMWLDFVGWAHLGPEYHAPAAADPGK